MNPKDNYKYGEPLKLTCPENEAAFGPNHLQALQGRYSPPEVTKEIMGDVDFRLIAAPLSNLKLW